MLILMLLVFLDISNYCINNLLTTMRVMLLAGWPTYRLRILEVKQELTKHPSVPTDYIYFITIIVIGHRFWLCKKSKRQNLDVVWNTGIPGSGDYP